MEEIEGYSAMVKVGIIAYFAALVFMTGIAGPIQARAESAPELNAAADKALERLKESQPVTQEMIEKAAGMLIFPNILKGGFIVGGAGGKGVLRVAGKPEAYYQSTSASFGLQAGITKFGYILLLMDDKSLEFIRNTDGWEIGTGPSVVVADQGVASKLSSTTAREGIYAFFVDQEGFYAGAGLEGTKISKIAE